jgi:glutamate synthase domain-containing protein 1
MSNIGERGAQSARRKAGYGAAIEKAENKQRKKSTRESQLYLRRATRDYGEQRERLQKREERGKRKNLDT